MTSASGPKRSSRLGQSSFRGLSAHSPQTPIAVAYFRARLRSDVPIKGFWWLTKKSGFQNLANILSQLILMGKNTKPLTAVLQLVDGEMELQ